MPDPRPVPACVALGSNVGDRRAHLVAAIEALARLPRTQLVTASDLIETDPVGPVPQGRYLNAAALLHTQLAPREFLDALLAIERARGRDRRAEERWGPRTLDLDLLLYGDLVLDEPGLTIPHPRLHERAFVLIPLAQVAGGMVVPSLQRTVRELLEALQTKPPAAMAVQPPSP
jgi:2-amino-4-hydroxy-6-hydroxymethyldihydropteridine diphosphokinase